MKRFLALTIFLISFYGIIAQNISVKSFRPLPMDMTVSSLEGKRIDQNGQVAALIKVMTTETGFVFEGGTLGIVGTQQRVGEIWVWVPRGLRKITILHQQLGGLRDYRFPIEIDAERTYEMVLTTAKIETIVKEEVRQQYLAFKITPPNAILEVNDQLWTVEPDGSAIQYVDFGTYTWRVRAANYHADAGSVTVDDPDSTKLVTVKLKPNFAEVTLEVDADAEIWVNNEKKGTRTWTGPMGKGTYKIECKQAGHETSMISKEITQEMDGQIIVLPVPKPVYGSLRVESNPNFCKLYIDGQDMGNTPKSLNEILIGEHQMKLVKEGYADYTETISIAKGEKKHMKPTLQPTNKAAVPSKPLPQTHLPVHRKRSAIFLTVDYAYSPAPQSSFGITFGTVKNVGWFISAASNFDFDAMNYSAIAESDGWVEGDEYPFYTGASCRTRVSAMAGLVFKIGKPIYFKLGAGYGYRIKSWRTGYGNLVKSSNDSFKGIDASAGIMLNLKGFAMSFDAVTTNFKTTEVKIGLGFML